MSSPDGAQHSNLRRADSFEEVKRRGHFRSTTARNVLAGLGRIFDEGVLTLLVVNGNTSTRFPTKEQVVLAGESLFAKAVDTDHVDIFVGHSWSAGRWLKVMALCVYFNLGKAVASSMLTWLITVAALLARGGWTGLGGSYLALPCLVYFPMVTFIIVLVFGQQLCDHFCGFAGPSLWVDKLCVHQTDMQRKAEQIASLPIFVTNSSRMLILWDDTYFERLWCNLELATFTRRHGAEQVEVLPLWLAPWLLCSITLDLLSVSLFELAEHVFPNWSVVWPGYLTELLKPVLGRNRAVRKFAAWFLASMMVSIIYLPACIVSFFSFRMKCQSHQLMLDQMASFDVRAAKCTMPADRAAIEQQVKELFRQSHAVQSITQPAGTVDDGEVLLQHFYPQGEASVGDPLDLFNKYVRGTLREFVIAQTGDELHVPYRLCLTASLPMIFYATVNVLGCDNGPCEESAVFAGFHSVGPYIAANAFCWALCILLAFPLTYSSLLRIIRLVFSYGDGPLQLLAAILSLPLAGMYSCICFSLIWAAVFPILQGYSQTKLWLCLPVMAFLICQILWLFAGHGGRNAARENMSCRCIKRHDRQQFSYDELSNPC